MSHIESTGPELAELVKRYGADYVEARLEESQSSHITYRGRELESIGRSTAIGGNVRALVKGGWGFICFDNFNELPAKVELAVRQARSVGKEVSRLAPVEPVTHRSATAETNPTAIPLADKKGLLDEYNEIIWRTRRYRPPP